jgi:NAD(P)-dependent dehydrogenase (short-subunit alcohol dehydrogenase family)
MSGCAVITGAGGLLGRAMAVAFAREGRDIVLADIDATKLAGAVQAVEREGRLAHAVVTDVSDPAAMDRLAEEAWTRLGRVDRLCLNAGLAILKPFPELTRADWDKVMGVQWNGVLNGVLSFVPRLIEQGGDRHIVIVSSMSGVGRADLRQLNAPYVTAKFACAGLAETMGPALAEHGIGVSLLCPGMTVANPEAMKGTTWPMASAAWYQDNLLDSDQVAAEVMAGIAEKRFYIFPHRAGRQEVLDRHARLMEGFDQAEKTSPPLQPSAAS